MRKIHLSALLGSASLLAIATAAHAKDFDIPKGDLKGALDAYISQAGVPLVVMADSVRGVHTQGAKGDMAPDVALSRILRGTGFVARQDTSGMIAVVPERAGARAAGQAPLVHLAESMTAHAAASVETVVVTSSKIKGDIQTVPIAITALSQEQLTSRQIAGGPDLVKEVPNLTFSKTNFTGYNIEIRGIGTQAISVTTDPAVAVAFNDTPFIRNHFFEQEFYDVAQVEVLRGPQGTLYGRNATAGVVNVVSAKPTDQFEAILSADWGNYHNRRYEGMVNLPIVGDKLALRIAGEWTKRDGYSFNETTNQPIDGRDLWSVRATLGWQPTSNIQTYLIWEHFSESDDRLRSGKQLCKTDFGPGANNIFDTGKLTASDGTIVTIPSAGGGVFNLTQAYFSQGCLPDSLYAKDSYEVPNGFSLPFINGASFEGFINTNIDPYSQTTQSTNLRNIQSAIEPRYVARNDTLEFNASWNIAPSLTLFSDTGFNNDFLWSTEDYNRFDTSPGIFDQNSQANHRLHLLDSNGVFCDPQLGCSDRLVVQDLSTEHAWQLSQEFRLASNFSGPFNFSVGANYLHYETDEYYYVFSNTFTMIALNNVGCNVAYQPGVTNNLYCLNNGRGYNPKFPNVGSTPTESPQYIDPNPLTRLDNEGHSYFLSQNPYVLNSYAGFGEAYFNMTPELKLTAGLRWTDDEKHVLEIPSELLEEGYGYQSIGAVDQKWNKWTGRLVANWTPKLEFTDQSMFYASFARGYKAGGANPPGALLLSADTTCGFTKAGCGAGEVNVAFPVHPATFKPEFIDAYELGTKNTLLDGSLTLNGNAFFYNYTGYQISQIVDRTSVNLNFNATVKGAELEATYEPLPGLKLSFAGGYEDTRIKDNQYAIDLIDRTAGVPGWIVMKPSVGQSSNCIVPEYVAAALYEQYRGGGEGNLGVTACGMAYSAHIDPITTDYYDPNMTTFTGYGGTVYNYPGFDPNSVDPSLTASQLAAVNDGLGLPPNNGEGFAKPVGGNQLPNAPHFTTSFTADYTMPVSANWAATLHGDFYWQSQSFARVFNDRPYDKIRGYSNVNAALILTDASGWQVMGYVKNIFDTTAITGDFLNSDDSGLTTNVFLTDPRLYGVRVTKHFDAGDLPGGTFDLFSDSGNGRPTIWLTVGGNYNATISDNVQPYDPLAMDHFPNGGGPTPSWASGLPTPAQLQKEPKSGFDWQGSLSYQPQGSDWVLKAGIRYGRTLHRKSSHISIAPPTKSGISFYGFYLPCSYVALFYPAFKDACYHGRVKEFDDSLNISSEKHAILDFTLGRDVGIGSAVSTTVSAGLRVAQFDSHSSLRLGAGPHYNFVPNFSQKYHEVYEFSSKERRSFHGMGPEIAWDGSFSALGSTSDGQVTFDWGINAAVLFGRQSVSLDHAVQHCRVFGFGTLVECEGASIGATHSYLISEPPDNVSRSRRVTVPNLGGYVGASVVYQNAKISLGYRADEFFNAIDGGEATAKTENRGFYGPYLNLSIGFGG